MWLWRALLGLSLAAGLSNAWAQDILCRFDAIVGSEAKKRFQQEPLEIRFIDIDDAKKTARMEFGTVLRAEVSVVKGPDLLSFVETNSLGEVNVTSVYLMNSKDGNSIAVHSRHSVGGKRSVDYSQRIGSCRLTNG